MTSQTTLEPPVPVDGDRPRRVVERPTVADRSYRTVLLTGAVLVLAVMSIIGAFLAVRGAEALREAGWSFFTTATWNPGNGAFGIAALLVGTVLIGLTAILLAFPLALGTALFISEYAPPRLQRALVNLVDLMAAVPSVVFGLWGAYLLEDYILVRGPQGEGLPRFLATYFSWLPMFEVQQAGEAVDAGSPATTGTLYTGSVLIAGVVVALMVTPIACSIMREAFTQAPIGEREGAYALGATRWGMIRAVVLPFGVGGMIGGTMLGLGRALGETIAVFAVISVAFDVKIRVLENGTSTVASLIALRFGEATEFGISALMAAGLALFAMTLVVNFAAAAVIARSRSGAVSD